MKIENPLSGIERVAVARAMGSAETVGDLAKAIETGSYDGQVTITVDFKLSKGDATEAEPTSRMLSLPVLAKAIRLSGIQRQNFYAAVKQAWTEAEATDEKVGDVVEAEDEKISAEIKALLSEVVAGMPKTKRSGTTRVQARITKAKLIQNAQELFTEVGKAFATPA